MALVFGAAGTLLASAASAASPYNEAYWSLDQSTDANGCSIAYDTPTPADAEIPTDGKAHVVDQAYVATVTGADPADVTKIAYSQHAVATVGAQGTNPSKIWLTYSGQSKVTPPPAPSSCSPGGAIDTEVQYAFTLTRPMWVNVNISNRGTAYSGFTLFREGGNPYLQLESNEMKFDTSGRAYLPAGGYGGFLEGVTNYGDPQVTGAPSGAVKATFSIPGSRTAGPAGTATGLVHMAAARNCTTHTLTSTITSRKKPAKTIRKVVLSVNGHAVRTIKHHFRGRTVTLSLPDTSAARVRATVTTVKKRHHHTHRSTRSVSASYLACR